MEAGRFLTWLPAFLRAMETGVEVEVPCGGCTACCRSSQFVEVGPDESATLEAVPPALLFPAPGRPGYRLMGFDSDGRCPMLTDDRCSIYESRPRACRTYDCRVFSATGVSIDEPARRAVAERVSAWEWQPDPEGDATRAAVTAAARFLARREEALPDDLVPRSATGRALMALELHELFRPDPADDDAVLLPVIERLRAARPRRGGSGQPDQRSGAQAGHAPPDPPDR